MCPRAAQGEVAQQESLEGLNGEIKRRSDVVLSSLEDAVLRLIGALLLEQNDEWAVQRVRSMTLESIAPLGANRRVSLPPLAT